MSPSQDDSCSSVDLKEYATSQGQGLAQVLIEYREQNKSLQFEVDDLKQKLQDAQGDIKVKIKVLLHHVDFFTDSILIHCRHTVALKSLCCHCSLCHVCEPRE